MQIWTEPEQFMNGSVNSPADLTREPFIFLIFFKFQIDSTKFDRWFAWYLTVQTGLQQFQTDYGQRVHIYEPTRNSLNLIRMIVGRFWIWTVVLPASPAHLMYLAINDSSNWCVGKSLIPSILDELLSTEWGFPGTLNNSRSYFHTAPTTYSRFPFKLPSASATLFVDL